MALPPDFDPDAPGTDSGLYGLPFQADDARVVVIPVPWEATTSYGRGAAAGPAAILAASLQVDLQDLDYGDFWRQGVALDAEQPGIRQLADAVEADALANIEATLPAARAAVDRMVFRVAALVGRNPAGATVAELSAPDRLPTPPEELALGRPVDLLNRRPDLILSQSSLQAAELRRTSAWLGLAPTLQLSGFTGDQGQLLGADATEWDWVGNWQVGLNASLPFFNGGRKLAAARGAAASARAGRFDLEQSTLNAVQEVEDSRRVLQQRNEELAARSAQVQAARLAFDESKAQYLGGTLPYVNVMTALSAAQSAELAHIQSRRDLVGAWITLQNALGAPWALDLDRPRGGSTGGGR